MKCRREICPNVSDEVAEKVKALAMPRGISVRTALVYDGRLSPRVEAEGFFDALVSADELLGLPKRYPDTYFNFPVR